MKKRVNYLLMFVLVSLLYSCGPSSEQARQFNDDVIAEQIAVINAINKLEAENATYKPERIEPALKAASEQIDKSLAVLNAMKNIDKETDFFPVTIEFIELFKSQVDNEYAKILEQYKLSNDMYDEIATNALLNSIEENYTPLAEKFSASQQRFADKYGFELVEQGADE